MSELSPAGAIVRRHDPDRFLTALFAPPSRREALFALYAFNYELERAREVASLAPIALIRLQWWREVVEGAERRHEVATPLGAAIRAGLLAPEDLLAMISAHETEAEEGLPSIAAWRDFVSGTAGGLAVGAARLLGAGNPEAFRPAGAAYGAGRRLRDIAADARRGRCWLPDDILAGHGLTGEAVIADPSSPAVSGVRGVLAGASLPWVVEALTAGVPREAITATAREAIAAALPVVFARRDLAAPMATRRPRGLRDRLAVTWAGLTGRLPGPPPAVRGGGQRR